MRRTPWWTRPGTFLGAGVLPVIDQQSRTVEIGYTVSPHARGRGVATQALSLLTDRAMDLGAERVVLHMPTDPRPRRD